MVRQFTAVFLLSIFVLTTLEDLTVLLLLRILSILVLFLSQRRPVLSTHFLSRFGVFSLAILLALTAVSFKTRDYTSEFNWEWESFSLPVLDSRVRLTGTVTQVRSETAVILRDSANREFYLRSDRPLRRGEQILVFGWFDPAKLDFFRRELPRLDSPATRLAQLRQKIARVLDPDFDFATRLFTQNFYGSISPQQIVPLGRTEEKVLSQTRNFLSDSLRSQFGKSRNSALAAGLLIGDRSMFSEADYDRFLESWLVHIIAVSGGNIILVSVFLGILFFRVPFYPRIFLTIFGVIGYGALTGRDSSVTRAVIMGSIGLIAILFGRSAVARRSLAIAAILMLLIDPYALRFDLGFSLSFAAVAWILLTNDRRSTQRPKVATFFTKRSPTNTRKNRPRTPRDFRLRQARRFSTQKIQEILIPTLGATRSTAPILLFFIGSINLLSIPANFVVVPLIPLLMFTSFFLTISPLIFTTSNFFLSTISNLHEFLTARVFRVSERAASHAISLHLTDKTFLRRFSLAILVRFLYTSRTERR